MTPSTPTAAQLALVQDLWQLDGPLKFIRRVENCIFESGRGGERLAVRFTEPVHRARVEIEAELDWMDHLAGQGLRLARPVPSRAGRLVEECSGEAPLFVAVFHWAAGEPLREPEEFTPQLMETWGRYLGRMNALSRTYRAPAGIARRREWDDDDAMRVARRGLALSDEAPRQAFEALLRELGGLPRTSDAYGLVHGDLHHGNFFVQEGRLTAFDFDDCGFHWYTYDLVVPLVGACDYFHRREREGPDRHLRERYLQGYLAESPLDRAWIARAATFARYRNGLLYHWTIARMAEGAFDAALVPVIRSSQDWWRRQLLEGGSELFS